MNFLTLSFINRNQYSRILFFPLLILHCAYYLYPVYIFDLCVHFCSGFYSHNMALTFRWIELWGARKRYLHGMTKRIYEISNVN